MTLRADAFWLRLILLDYLPIKQAPLSSLDALTGMRVLPEDWTRGGLGPDGCSFDI